MIYFIQIIDPFARIKIGHTDGVLARRLASIRMACPYQVRLLGSMDGDEATEIDLHRRFAEHAVIGEWFEPAPELLEFCSALEQGAPCGLFQCGYLPSLATSLPRLRALGRDRGVPEFLISRCLGIDFS